MTLIEEAPDTVSWKILDHCIVVLRTYALFETFVVQLLREYLSFLSKSYKLSELGNKFVGKYTRGIGQILIDQDKARYENLDVSALVANAMAALSNGDSYEIQPEAMLRTEQNLRMDELQRLFGHCGLQEFENWVTNHVAVRGFFAAQSRLSETAATELKQIVDYRNEAAHGDVDQVLGTEILLEVTEFFESLLQSITDFVQHDILRRAKELGTAQVLGVVSECFRDDIVVAKITNARLKVGDIVYILGRRITMIGEIKSIQLDGVDHLDAEIATQREVGLRLGVSPSKGCELIRLNQPD